MLPITQLASWPLFSRVRDPLMFAYFSCKHPILQGPLFLIPISKQKTVRTGQQKGAWGSWDSRLIMRHQYGSYHQEQLPSWALELDLATRFSQDRRSAFKQRFQAARGVRRSEARAEGGGGRRGGCVAHSPMK